jgi:MoxR-like ATPase
MEEHQITVDGVTHALPRPFMVLATQNPIEYEGTFPLPEAQLDRFLVRLTLGYPEMNDEINILERQQFQHPVNDLQQVASADELMKAQESIKSIYVAPAIKRYIVELTRQTRQHVDVYLGASPRGSLALFRTGQARAAIQGRDFVLPDDIKALVKPALSHRVILGPAARLRDLSGDQILDEILSKVPVPGGDLKASS